MNHENDEVKPNGEQDELDQPVMDVDEVPAEEKLRGIIIQTVSDLGNQHSHREIEAVVQERSAESELPFSRVQITTAFRLAVTQLGAEDESDAQAL